MTDAPDDEVIRQLYRTDPDQFVARRDALVKELKQAGRKEAAAALAKLRRPKVAEHTLNVLAHDEPALVAAWADAVAAAEDEQAAVIGGAPATGLAPLLAEVRTSSARLIDAAVHGLGAGGAVHRTAIADALRAATSTAGAARVRAGLMGAPFEPPEEFFPGTEHVAVRPRSVHPPKSKPTRATTAAADGPIAEVVPLRSRKEDEAARRAAAKAAAEEERRRRAAEAARRKAVELATAKVAAAKERQAAAQRTLDAATAAVHEAEAELAALEHPAP